MTGKFKSAGRVRKLVQGINTWQPTSSPGREVAEVPTPVAFVRPLAQYAVRTPSKEHKEGYYHAVVFTSRTDLTMTGVVEHYDGRAGMEADRKCDKHGLGLAVIRKRLLPARDAGRAAGRVSPQHPDVGPLLAQPACTPPA